jgi:hypothetical protein
MGKSYLIRQRSEFIGDFANQLLWSIILDASIKREFPYLKEKHAILPNYWIT